MEMNITYIKRLMEDKGLNVSDLARLMGKKESWVYAILNGTHGKTFSTVDAVAAALGVPAKELLE